MITNEMHGHIGIYALLGMKMGLRAREYFGVGPDRLSVVSLAGNKPPVSCLNDGIQVSTGATIGHGLISIDPGIERPSPTARFTCRGRTIEIALKEEYAEEVRKDVTYGMEAYDLQDPRYWQYIEELALRYWVEWGRHTIFSVEC